VFFPRAVVEPIGEHEAHVHRVVEVLAEGATSVQSYEIVRLGGHGRALVIDGRVQSTEANEAIYHESLLLPAFTFAPSVARVLCLGGANGGILHRVLALPGVTSVWQFDVDAELHKRSVEHLPHMHLDALDDPRAIVRFGHPRVMLENLEGSFDLVLADLPDAVPGTHVPGMFSREFYLGVRKLLGSTGVFATQAGPANPLEPAFMAGVLRTARDVFVHAHPYTSAVPAFGVSWGFVVASDHPFTPGSPGARMRDVPDSASTYDAETHCHMFAVPRLLREGLATAGRVITDDDPMWQA
jgi:spermidine synthase